MKKYFGKEGRLDYAPALLGNGEMSLQLDFMGQQAFEQTELDKGEQKPTRVASSNNIWWAGRRYIYDFKRFLIPFGQLLTDVEGLADRPQDWNQTLDALGAQVFSECLYEGGDKINVQAFVHHDMNLLAIRRKFDLTEKRTVKLNYRLRSRDDDKEYPRYMQVIPTADPVTGGWRIHYSVIGQWDYEGVILLFADRPLTREWQGNVFTLSGATKDEELTLYLIMRDNIDEENYEEVAVQQAKDALRLGYDGLYAEHKAKWDTYYAESHVKLPDENLMGVYQAAQYDMKCFTTRWSIPVALNDVCWEGKFFAYDEYFGYSGLLTGNHLDLAGRVPRFRKQGLAQAIKRMTSKIKVDEARYPWETSETGEECATPGFWYEHIFHMANISIGAWEYYAYTNDVEFLRETAWPMMRACAEFFLRHMVYHIEGGKTIIGRCTDWERMGSSVQNAYTTTCSVIRTLNLTVKAAKILGIDPQDVAEAEEIAAKLYDGLPNNGERYIPHPDCGELRNIGVFSGMFPYRVMDENNPMQRAAIDDYHKHEAVYGNMYAVGGSVCAWFAGWKGIAYARMHEPERVMASLRQTASTQGCFGELYEINEEKCMYRPWFSTANGIFLAAVHNALIQSDDGLVDILPGYPAEEGDVCFELPAEGDLMVGVCVSGGQLKKLSLKPGKNCAFKQVTVRLPAWLSLQTAQVEDGGLAIVQL